jgi:hypothetical protein
MDPNVQEVIDQIINKPPMADNSISLDFAPEEENMDIVDVFDFLLIFLCQLCKKLYPTSGKLDLSMMTGENITSVNRYFHSMGFELEVDKIPWDHDYADEVQAGRYDKIIITPGMKLSKLYMPVISQNIIYLIRFDFYKGS